MDFYKIAIETGLSHDAALFFATAMTHKVKPSIDHLKIIK